MQRHDDYQVMPFPLERLVTIQGGRLASRWDHCGLWLGTGFTAGSRSFMPFNPIRLLTVSAGNNLEATAFVLDNIPKCRTRPRRERSLFVMHGCIILLMMRKVFYVILMPKRKWRI